MFDASSDLTFQGGQTVTLTLDPDGTVSETTMTQLSGPELTYGRVNVGGLFAGGSINSPGNSGAPTFTFTFPDDDGGERLALFPFAEGPVNLELELPSVTANTSVELQFVLAEGNQSNTLVVDFTLTPAGSGQADPGNVTISGKAKDSDHGQSVFVYGVSKGAPPTWLGTTYVSFDGTYSLSVDKRQMSGDTLFVFLETESVVGQTHSVTSHLGRTHYGTSRMQTLKPTQHSLEIDFVR